MALAYANFRGLMEKYWINIGTYCLRIQKRELYFPRTSVQVPTSSLMSQEKIYEEIVLSRVKNKEKDPTYKFKKYIDQLSKVLRPPDKYKDPNSLQLDHIGAFLNTLSIHVTGITSDSGTLYALRTERFQFLLSVCYTSCRLSLFYQRLFVLFKRPMCLNTYGFKHNDYKRTG